MSVDSFWKFYFEVLDSDETSSYSKKRKKRKRCVCTYPNGSLKGTKSTNIKWRHSFCRRCSGVMDDKQKDKAFRFYCEHIVPLKLNNQSTSMIQEMSIQITE